MATEKFESGEFVQFDKIIHWLLWMQKRHMNGKVERLTKENFRKSYILL
jgi:hypothetical protein